MKHTISPVRPSPPSRTKLSMQVIVKKHEGVITRAILLARKNPGCWACIGFAPNLGMQQVLAKATGCLGKGPYRWSRNEQGYWFITYEEPSK